MARKTARSMIQKIASSSGRAMAYAGRGTPLARIPNINLRHPTPPAMHPDGIVPPLPPRAMHPDGIVPPDTRPAIAYAGRGTTLARIPNIKLRHPAPPAMHPDGIVPPRAMHPDGIVPPDTRPASVYVGRGTPEINMPRPSMMPEMHPEGIVPFMTVRRGANMLDKVAGMSRPVSFSRGSPNAPRRGSSNASKATASGPSSGHKWGGWAGASSASILGTALGGGFLGGAASWMTGGEFTQGAFFGATAAVGGRYMLRNRTALASFGESAIGHVGGKNAGAYSSKLTELASQFNTRESRRNLIATGALLGGFAFGGDRSHKRGFNAHRGNSIGR